MPFDKDVLFLGNDGLWIRYFLLHKKLIFQLPIFPALIKQCHLLITNDSGPMHIAAAVRTPTVSIFSAVDIPFLWYPTGNNHKIFYNKVECSPCFQKECDNHICMEGISVENVYKAVKEQLYNMDLKKER